MQEVVKKPERYLNVLLCAGVYAVLGKCSPNGGHAVQGSTLRRGCTHTHTRAHTYTHPTHTLKLVRGAVPSPIPAKHHLQLLFSPALHSQRPDPLPHLPRYPGVHAELWCVCVYVHVCGKGPGTMPGTLSALLALERAGLLKACQV